MLYGGQILAWNVSRILFTVGNRKILALNVYVVLANWMEKTKSSKSISIQVKPIDGTDFESKPPKKFGKMFDTYSYNERRSPHRFVFGRRSSFFACAAPARSNSAPPDSLIYMVLCLNTA